MSIELPKRLFQFVLIPQLCLFALGIIACQSVPPLEPPQFDYRQLSNRYFRSNLGGHFPLTIQRGANLHPITTATGHLFYTSNRDGSGDIWMRDLSNTVNVPLIQHPAEQYRPAVPDDGTRLVFVSEDADSNGDLRIVNIDPEEIVQNMIDGISPGDLWDNSRDLSARIEELAQELPEVCRGESAETDPVWRPDGSALVFASDRCSPGTYNLWMVRMEDDEPVGPLIPVTTEGGVQPRFNIAGDALAFISYRNNHHGGRPYIVYFVGMREVEVPLPRNAANPAYIYTNPSFGQNGTHLYYTSIRRDTNKNGSIDRNDNGALYSLKLNANGGVQQEKQLLDNEHNILSSIYTNFIGGSFLYAAELYNSVNIYFIQPQGVVPAEASIEEQYNLTLRYRSENPDRYLLSLDTVRQQFGQTPEFFLYRGRIMIDRLVFQQQRGRLNKTDSIDDNLTELIEHNPYAKLEWQLHNAGNSGADPIPILEDFLRQTDAGAFTEKLSTTQIDLMRAATMERLARAYARGERSPAALETVRTLNADYPDYYLHFQTL
ncbi:MAG: PD40 domain-containing protein, partial [Leptospiraceae bacterium]|nr:PD40 domain-containing protein [Leptospiraceae bacterium]